MCYSRKYLLIVLHLLQIYNSPASHPSAQFLPFETPSSSEFIVNLYGVDIFSRTTKIN